MASEAQWVAVDWGTSNVRAWGMAADGSEAFAASADKGMGKIKPADFPAVLDELIGRDFAGGDVVICGMAGARQGWREAPYLDVPADLDHLLDGAVRPEGADARFRPRILPGICQRRAGQEDVMRGEETQLLGLLALQPGFEGTVVLPGTHSKWVEIRKSRVIRFSSAMTGELYQVLSEHSVLRHTVAAGSDSAEAESGITEGIAAGLRRPDLLTSLAFRARAAALLSGKSADWCSGYLSGLLVGTEVGGHRDWLGSTAVPLIGSARFARLYGAALRQAGADSVAIDASEATIAGLKRARAQA